MTKFRKKSPPVAEAPPDARPTPPDVPPFTVEAAPPENGEAQHSDTKFAHPNDSKSMQTIESESSAQNDKKPSPAR